MANLLRNKVVVSCLVATAGLGIAANFVKLPVSRPLEVSARAAEAIGPNESFELPPPLTIAGELVSWRESRGQKPARDPFAWIQGSSVGSVPTVGAPAPSYRLQAISIEADQAFVVLDHRVVGRGEKVGEYVVERILPTEVWLRGPAGQIIVR